jgi:hypothetical protein
VSEADAAFKAAALQDVAAGFGSHALEETVLTGTVTLFGLKSSLWHIRTTILALRLFRK